tara:strand:- start:11 stop:199 length:189 start_codon:yes stop_codon:yes gene_type:complete
MKLTLTIIKAMGIGCLIVGSGTLISYALNYSPKMAWLTAVTFVLQGTAIVWIANILKDVKHK